MVGRTPDNFESQERIEESKEGSGERAAFDPLELMKEGSAKGDRLPGAAVMEFAAKVQDPESLDRSQKEFDSKFERLKADDSPESFREMQKMFGDNEAQLKAAQVYIAQLQKTLADRAALV